LSDVVTVVLDLTLRMALDAPRGQQQSLPLHRSVAEAIARGDGSAAAAAMLHLVDSAERDVREALAAGCGSLSPRTPPLRAAKKSSGSTT
jgi:DNA-binding FadR family transcriptional regulator